jgi:hypothetical protein
VALTPATNGGGLFVDGARVHTFTAAVRDRRQPRRPLYRAVPAAAGARRADSTFNGDIDEVEVFTAAVPDADVHALWLRAAPASVAELALVNGTPRCERAPAGDVCGSIGNFAAAAANYQWTLQALGAGLDCPARSR